MRFGRAAGCVAALVVVAGPSSPSTNLVPPDPEGLTHVYRRGPLD